MLRFAPSPTGFLHIGNARVAVLNYLYAQKKKKLAHCDLEEFAAAVETPRIVAVGNACKISSKCSSC